jgi:hypothetical protein
MQRQSCDSVPCLVNAGHEGSGAGYKGEEIVKDRAAVPAARGHHVRQLRGGKLAWDKEAGLDVDSPRGSMLTTISATAHAIAEITAALEHRPLTPDLDWHRPLARRESP